MSAATNTAARSSVALAVDGLDKRFGAQWLRWPLAGSVLLCGGGGALALGPSAMEIEALEAQVAVLEAQVDSLESQVDVLQGRDMAIYEMAAVALELSVDGQRYLVDVLVDVAGLDHPGYKPPLEDPRLGRKKTHGGQLLNALGTPKP